MNGLFILIGKTRRGKNHVANYGERWWLRDTKLSVSFSQKPGPWLLLESMDDVEAGKGHDSFLIWVHPESDIDHEIRNIV